MGYATARLFAEEGATVILADVLSEVSNRAEELQLAGFRSTGFVIDLCKSKEVYEMVVRITDAYGKIDVLCNVAGGSVPPRPSFIQMSEEYWDMVVDRNLKTTFNCCRAVVPGMVHRGYGRIINWSSITGPKTAYHYSAAYAASKGAVSGFTRALAEELGQYSITVNAILPGWIDTRDEPQDVSVPASPISRPGRPEECARLALFLASGESSFITGAEIVIDGGVTVVEWIAGNAFSART
jgi:NAD(P)-dependent dehydrogenase (short-subunit alcohol dehydrogenase family)